MIYNYEQDPELSRNGNVYSFDDYLEHHGIAGQKWGVKHGPPYPLVNAAKTIHYNVGKMTDKTREAYRQHKERKQASLEQKQAVKIQKKEDKAANRAQKAEAKDKRNSNIAEAGPKKFVKSKQRISDMSSEELQARINRLKLEQEYRKYLNGGVEQKQIVKNGKSQLDSMLNAVQNSTAKKVGDILLTGIAKLAVDAASNSIKNSIERGNARKTRNAEFVHDERKRVAKEAADDANREKSRARRNQDIFNDTYYKKMAEEMAWQHANEARKNYERWVSSHTLGG